MHSLLHPAAAATCSLVPRATSMRSKQITPCWNVRGASEPQVILLQTNESTRGDIGHGGELYGWGGCCVVAEQVDAREVCAGKSPQARSAYPPVICVDAIFAGRLSNVEPSSASGGPPWRWRRPCSDGGRASIASGQDNYVKFIKNSLSIRKTMESTLLAKDTTCAPIARAVLISTRNVTNNLCSPQRGEPYFHAEPRISTTIKSRFFGTPGL